MTTSEKYAELADGCIQRAFEEQDAPTKERLMAKGNTYATLSVAAAIRAQTELIRRNGPRSSVTGDLL